MPTHSNSPDATSVPSSGLKRFLVLALLVMTASVFLVPGFVLRAGPPPDNSTKGPEVITAGPGSVPYQLTDRERAKLATVTEQSVDPALLARDPRMHPPGRNASPGPYPGPTAAEQAKLHALLAGGAGERANVTGTAYFEKKLPPIKTAAGPPRPPGAEGLTPAEREKLGGEGR